MYCTQCGFKLDDGDVFCAQCGRATRADAPLRAESRRKRLVRPIPRKKIAGVCAGCADYFDVDVTLMRILWVLGIFLSGASVIAYIVAWIAMPVENGPATAQAY